MIEDRTQPTRAYISYTAYFFRTIFYLNNYSLRDPPLHTPPEFFLFSRPPFTTHIRDPHFETHIRDPILRLAFAT